MERPVLIITIEHTDERYGIIDRGEDTEPRYALLDPTDTDLDRYSNDRSSLIRTAVRRLDRWVAEQTRQALAS